MGGLGVKRLIVPVRGWEAMGVEGMGVGLLDGAVGEKVAEAKELAADLCKHFYNQGWVSGTGGSITLKVLDPNVHVQEQLIVMAPSGTPKMMITSFTMPFLLNDPFLALAFVWYFYLEDEFASCCCKVYAQGFVSEVLLLDGAPHCISLLVSAHGKRKFIV